MCYSIPGKVVEINNNIVTLDYFGELRKARNEFYTLAIGDYTYAQAGFIIQKITKKDAKKTLSTWKELFKHLQEIDTKLASKTENLYQKANNVRQKYHGNSCCVHGIIEFSNYCSEDCLYCGIRKSNHKLERYRMSVEEIIEAAGTAVKKHGFKALVLQSGEDMWYTDDKLISIIDGIRATSPCLLSISIGERSLETYTKLYERGVRGVLLRFETSNREVYSKMKPSRILEKRINLIRNLHEAGYLIMTGFLIGLPGLNDLDVEKSIEMTGSFGTDMFSFGPLIPHNETPLADIKPVNMEHILNTIANARIKNPEAKILVTTSMETLDRENALKLGLMSGANSIMLNVTPEKYRKLYEIYPDRAGINIKIEKRIKSIIKLLQSIGRAPTDLGL